MASVAVPMITSKAIGMVGEKMGLDPRLTAVASAMGGFGAGTAYSSYSGAKAINAANAADQASNTAARAINKGIGFGNAEGQALWNASNMPNVDVNNIGAYNQAAHNATGVNITGTGPNMLERVDTPFNFNPKHVDAPFKPQALKELKTIGPDTTTREQWDKNIDKWKTRPVDKETGEEIGLSRAENLGAEMLSTLMSDLPEEPRQFIKSGGGGGGSVAPYRGGGGFVERKVLSNLGGNRERRFKPQGI